jgi:hypothetical protein
VLMEVRAASDATRRDSGCDPWSSR